MKRVFVWRVRVTSFPPRSHWTQEDWDPHWQPEGWEADLMQMPDGSVEETTFGWPTNRRHYLTAGAARRRADLLRLYGATVEVERSLPVEWQP